MSRVLIIGAGGVGNVVAHKCAQAPEVFSEIVLASRTLARCTQVAQTVRQRQGRDIEVAAVDADDVAEIQALLARVQPDVVINVALPYQDLSIMDACLATRTPYLDTANYEPVYEARFEYKWQWAYHDRFREAGIMALLGAGFDPGVTNAFCAYAHRALFDEIHCVDILDCNAGDHGRPFATNFNPEVNLREITQPGRYWEDGAWRKTDPLSETLVFDFPEIGPRKAYLLYHEELESLVKHLPELRRVRFWMTFGDEYLTHLRVLQNVGMTSIEPVLYEEREVVPLKFLKTLLPDPASLAPSYRGKTCIGCLIEGRKGAGQKRVFIYNVCNHEASYQEVGAQAISYTTGVPAMVGALLMVTGQWREQGVFNVEQLDPGPFLEALASHGLPWHVRPH